MEGYNNILSNEYKSLVFRYRCGSESQD